MNDLQLEEAKQMLRDLGFPAAQTNDRSGRTLQALAQVSAKTRWSDATNEMLGVRALMDWMRSELDHPIAENSRETVRRQTLHQFLEAGLVIFNEDDPGRPTNSSLSNYKLNNDALALIKSYGSPQYAELLKGYLEKNQSLAEKYKATRAMSRIPLKLPNGFEMSLGAGGQNVLLKSMVDDFCSYFVPNGEVLYIGDADSKLSYFAKEKFMDLGVIIEEHGKLPDLVVFQKEKNWLFLMEAASSHGPVDSKRHSELSAIFANSSAGLVYVSCFPDKATMRKFLADLAWETEVWLSSDPTHMIHLNGDRFLGPH